MPRIKLLVSIRNAAEAEAALAGGANWIDLKEPSRGSLGAVEASVAREAVACVASRAPISAAAGELADWPRGRSRELLEVAGISHLKLGMAGLGGTAWHAQWRAAQWEIESAGKKLASVVYADVTAALSPMCAEIVQAAAVGRCEWILFDTFDKRSGDLRSHLNHDELTGLFSSIRAGDGRTIAAGRLSAESIVRLPLKLIDMIAVRGATCDGGREGIVRSERVAELRALLDAAV